LFDPSQLHTGLAIDEGLCLPQVAETCAVADRDELDDAAVLTVDTTQGHRLEFGSLLKPQMNVRQSLKGQW
jgi:hypothetical protein